jgi:hypothetical protein
MNGAASEPLIEEVEEICRREPACKLFWCERVTAIDWFHLMAKRNWFTNPPNIIRQGQTPIYPGWPESASLLRFVKIIPADVARVLVTVPQSDNPRVGDQILRVVAEFHNISDIRLVREKVRNILADHARSARLWLLDLLRNWVSAGASNEVLSLLPQVFSKPADGETTIDAAEAWELSQIDEDVMSKLASSDAKRLVDVLGLIVDKIIGAQTSDDILATAVWLEDFSKGERYSHETEAILILRLYNTCRDIIQRESEGGSVWVDELLCRHSGALFQRMRWQLYSDFPEYFLDQARYEVLQRIPHMSRVLHAFEFQNMINVFAHHDGLNFMSEGDISRIVEAIGSGPLTAEGEVDSNSSYVARFRAKQIQPFRPLLANKKVFMLRGADGEEVRFEPDDYKPFRLAGEVHTFQEQSPVTADRLAAMTDSELWTLLNAWTPDTRSMPDKWWIEEGVSGLANAFAEAVELDPSHFPARAQWWTNLKRPVFFWRLLDRALVGENSPAPSDESWATWFGLCEFVVAQHPIEKPDEKGQAEDTSAANPTWKYARWSAARLIERGLKYKDGPPPQYAARIAALLQKLATEEDPRVEEIDKSWSSSSFDWLSKGINSAAGTAVEGLLLFALWQKKISQEKAAPAWVTDVLEQQLTKQTQSPAIFAVLGSQLPLLAHLFPSWCKDHRETIFPFGRRTVHAEAALLSHLKYNNPAPFVIATFPTLPDEALQFVKFEGEQTRRVTAREEIPVRVGYHLAYYYWNALPNEATAERRIDEFFNKAPPPTRGRLISELGRIFKRVPATAEDATKRVRALWDKRSAFISTKVRQEADLLDSFTPELASFSFWVGNDRFDERWRLIRLSETLELLEKSPEAFDLLEALDKLSASPENLRAVMRCVQLLTEKFSDQLRWSIREEHLKSILTKGLKTTDSRTRNLAEAARDNLLKQGLFIYQDI